MGYYYAVVWIIQISSSNLFKRRKFIFKQSDLVSCQVDSVRISNDQDILGLCVCDRWWGGKRITLQMQGKYFWEGDGKWVGEGRGGCTLSQRCEIDNGGWRSFGSKQPTNLYVTIKQKEKRKKGALDGHREPLGTRREAGISWGWQHMQIGPSKIYTKKMPSCSCHMPDRDFRVHGP